jgi:hypothetical protein
LGLRRGFSVRGRSALPSNGVKVLLREANGPLASVGSPRPSGQRRRWGGTPFVGQPVAVAQPAVKRRRVHAPALPRWVGTGNIEPFAAQPFFAAQPSAVTTHFFVAAQQSAEAAAAPPFFVTDHHVSLSALGL